ncbi:MAG: DUF2752 domain-containing protein, partial [Oscillospiraceae bacterium]|nr:DUF2752 domain-containing protein [Oscillospiraceae bacterium]
MKNLKSTIKLLWLIPITGTFVVIGNKFFGAGCLFQMITGLPCMGCGGTRAFLALIKGDFAEMFFYFPLLPLCIFSVLVYFVIWIFSLTPPTVFIKIG